MQKKPAQEPLMVNEPVNIYAAKTQLSRLVDLAAAGDDVVLSRHGKPLARLTALKPPRRVVRYGLLKGQIRVAADFDAPLPADVVASFEGS